MVALEDKIAVRASCAGDVNLFLKLTEMHDKMPRAVKENIENRLPESTLQALEWARDFMKIWQITSTD